jgi:putative nucleotidyltransferase with HDIG domain
MSRGIDGWTPELERSFKELLFRFLEEVQATKAALYLFGEGTYLLATQYGFHRHDLLATEHHASDPLARKVREDPDSPQVFNQIEEIADAATYLQGANTSRLLLLPLKAGARVVGFVDIRDKGRKRPFEPEDIDRTREIGEAVVHLIRQAALYPNLEDEIAAPPPPRIQQPVMPDRPGGTIAMIDELGLSAITEVATELALAPNVAGVAITVVAEGKAGMIWLGGGITNSDHEAMVRHQLETLRMSGIAGPDPPAWRVDHRAVAAATELSQAQHIASAVLLLSRGWSMLGSVLATTSAGTARTPLLSLQRAADRAHHDTGLRWARRCFARRLINPATGSYPQLVKHSMAVSHLCWKIAGALGGSVADREEAAVAGLLHDVGMYEIEQQVFSHPSPGPAERSLYQQHVVSGALTATEVGSDRIARAIRHHHERWDGKGYPDRLAKDAIPPLARLVHAAEVYDTLTASHSYLVPVSPGQAFSIIKAAAGTQFDPNVVEVLAGVTD